MWHVSPQKLMTGEMQLTLGQDWSEIMYSAIRVTGSFKISWYFVSFLVIVTLVFTNVSVISLMMRLGTKFSPRSLLELF